MSVMTPQPRPNKIEKVFCRNCGFGRISWQSFSFGLIIFKPSRCLENIKSWNRWEFQYEIFDVRKWQAQALGTCTLLPYQWSIILLFSCPPSTCYLVCRAILSFSSSDFCLIRFAGLAGCLNLYPYALRPGIEPTPADILYLKMAL